jgi:hypothetical protein
MTKRHTKERLTVTVDPELVKAGDRAVRAGLAESLSAWVNAALVHQVQRDAQRRAANEAIAAYEAEFGAITDADVRAVEERDRREARARRTKRRSA